jgi:glycosyltransferase involved in cell wall biosynthesis
MDQFIMESVDPEKDTVFNYPLVSIIIITYNSSRYISETLESSKNQTYQNIELIISDDASADNTIEICREWVANNNDRFKRTEIVTSSKNTGIASNLNRGIKAAKGIWIKAIAGDDAFEPEIISSYIDYLVKNKHVRVLHSNVKKYLNNFADENLIETTDLFKLKINQPFVTPKKQFQILLRSGPIMGATSMIKRDVFDEVGLYDEESPFWEDNPMWLKITKNGINIHFMNIVGAKYRVHPESVQGSKRNGQLFSYYQLSRDVYYKNNYLRELPFLERLLTGLIINRNIFIERITNNKRSLLILIILNISDVLPNLILSRLNKKHFK